MKSCRETSSAVSMMLTLPPRAVADDAGCEDGGIMFDI